MDLRGRLSLWRMRRQVGARDFARFGERSVVEPPAVVLNPGRIEIGDGVVVHSGAWFSVVTEHNGRSHDAHLRIGDRTTLGRNCMFSCVGTIEIGAECLIGHQVLFSDSYHHYEDPEVNIVRQPMAEPRGPLHIGEGVHIGPNAVILAGVTIGDRAFVGAGSVVTKDVPANAVVAGNPARILRHYDHQRGVWVDGPPPGSD